MEVTYALRDVMEVTYDVMTERCDQMRLGEAG